MSSYDWQQMAIVVGFIVGLGPIALDYFIKEPRAKNVWRIAVVVALIAAFAVAFLQAREAHREGTEAERKAQQRADRADADATTTHSELASVQSKLSESKTTLTTVQGKLDQLRASVEPVLEVVRARNPGATDAQALANLAVELRMVREKTAVLEERTSQRHLSTKQRAELVSLARNHRMPDVTIAALSGNAEAAQFAQEILQALREAGWNVQTYDVGNFGQTDFGIHASYGGARPHGQEELQTVAAILMRGGVIGPNNKLDLLPPLADSTQGVTIFIGAKRLE